MYGNVRICEWVFLSPYKEMETALSRRVLEFMEIEAALSGHVFESIYVNRAAEWVCL